MSPLAMWICFVVGGSLYQATKWCFGFTPDWNELFNGAYYTGAAMLVVHFVMVRAA